MKVIDRKVIEDPTHTDGYILNERDWFLSV